MLKSASSLSVERVIVTPTMLRLVLRSILISSVLWSILISAVLWSLVLLEATLPSPIPTGITLSVAMVTVSTMLVATEIPTRTLCVPLVTVVRVLSMRVVRRLRVVPRKLFIFVVYYAVANEIGFHFVYLLKNAWKYDYMVQLIMSWK